MVVLRLSGEVDSPRSFAIEELALLPGQVADVGAIALGKHGAGVRLTALLEEVGARGDHLLLVAADGFSISVPRAGVTSGVVAYRLAGAPLPASEGGPLRFYVGRPVACDEGEVDACANVKRLVEIRVTNGRAPDTHHHG